jgi:hypothetical protein
MNVLALGYGFKKVHYDIITRISENVLYRPIQAVDLRSFEPTPGATDAVITFGPRAQKFFEKANKGCTYFLALAPIQNLEDSDQNDKEKEKAWKSLLAFKEALDSCVAVTEDDLPDMDSSDILSLEAQLKKRGVSEWFGTTKNGKTICLSLSEAGDRADVNLSFAELYALKTAMEVLEVEEVIIR